MIKQIYVVEDDQDIRQIIEIILEDEGYKVRLFPDISSFHAAKADTIPDLYLLDVMLPDGNGLDLCKEIRTSQQTKDIPIIVMSAHAREEAIFKQCNPNDFISKPFDLNDILFKIKKQIMLH
ncbi:response regulator transcription factor [Pedobacter cryoconitis]|uniref:DNA-binding response OmpR family regulator n=1 Tax=Pedobacter cryoconitis TaxID=188932 RepID=A0A7X0J8C9_9SPHI|nr:response regulator transcription factor [Pedobacter cryoconitis]MBB6502539.1 DNA-binding response OmpR family regulator [Pedobacter cryoconitis]